MSLVEYRKSRDLARIHEPQGRPTRASRSRRFVVQKHASSGLHFDFRLEVDGVLKSWAIPNGPSLDPADRRVAILVEDQPLAPKASGERVFAPSNRDVVIWDHGSWKPRGDAGEGIRTGHLAFALDGEKLQGIWELIRMGGRRKGKQETWLLVKRNDEHARLESVAIAASDPERAATLRSMKEITEEIKARTRRQNMGAAKKNGKPPAPTPRRSVVPVDGDEDDDRKNPAHAQVEETDQREIVRRNAKPRSARQSVKGPNERKASRAGSGGK